MAVEGMMTKTNKSNNLEGQCVWYRGDVWIVQRIDGDEAHIRQGDKKRVVFIVDVTPLSVEEQIAWEGSQ